MTGDRAGGEIVLASALVGAGHADALQVAHFAGIFGCKLLRIDAERAEKLRQLVGGVRPLGAMKRSSPGLNPISRAMDATCSGVQFANSFCVPTTSRYFLIQAAIASSTA